MDWKKRSIVAVCIGLLSGCAFGDAHLDIAYDKSKAISGPLSSVPAMLVTSGQFKDSRPETGLIGYKRNGYGQHTADIKPTKPVPEIVRDALETMFRKAGHKTGDGGDIVVSGKIKKFWFDVKVGILTVEFMGDVAMHLVISDAKTSELIYEQDYDGSYSEDSMGGFEKTWQRVLNEALSKMMESISLDADLSDALVKHRK